MSFYEVKIVNRAAPHAVIATFDSTVDTPGDSRDKASIDQVTWVLNEPGSFTFRVPVFHPAAPLVVPLMCEAQVWRNGALIAWGIPLQPSLEGGAWVFQCPGLLWYFTRRVFGPISTNYLTNPNFTTDLTGWTATGVTATHSTALRIRGPGTAKLVAVSSGDKYLEQTFLISTGGVGVVLFLTGWYWIDPADPITTPALEERGLYIDAPNSLPDSTPSWEPITMNAEVGKPQRCPEVELHLPASLVNEPVTVRLYAGAGTIHWGALSVTALESVSSLPGGTDVTAMMEAIVVYMHDAYAYNITTSCPAAGVTEIIAYQFADLGNCFDALKTYPARGLADFEIVLTSATARTFTTYAPRKGSYHAGNPLAVPGTDVNLNGYRLDGQQTATRVIRRGAGDGSDRELGVAIDGAALGGLPLDDVQDAPPEIPIDGLDGLADTDLARLSQIVALPEMDTPAAGWIGSVEPGDTVDVTIDWGAVQETTVRRVVSMTLTPATDRVSVGVNVE